MFCNYCATNNIEIVNVKNNEIINHSILYIRGRVKRICGVKKIQIEYKFNDYQPEIISDIQVSGRNKEFKLLIDLQKTLHENSVTPGVSGAEELKLRIDFSYCAVKQNLEVFYKPIENAFKLQPIIIVCREKKDSDEQLSKNPDVISIDRACEIIDLNIRLIQCIYADRINNAGYGRCTFVIQDKCQIFQSSLTREQAWEFDEHQLWRYFADELLNYSLWEYNKRIKFVAFIACTRYNVEAIAASGDFSYANIRKNLNGHAALGGGGLALFGSAYFYAWPRCFHEILSHFENNTKVDLYKYPDDSNYRRTYGGVYATTLGTVCHELGHTFDLGHTKNGIMGSGFDYLNDLFITNDDDDNEHVVVGGGNRTSSKKLPQRIIESNNKLESHRSVGNVEQKINIKNRLTKFKDKGASYLDIYREQLENGMFYFTKNCAVILAHHKWLKLPVITTTPTITTTTTTDNTTTTTSCVSTTNYIEIDDNNINFDYVKGRITSTKSNPIVLLEFRCKATSLATRTIYFESNPISEYHLESTTWNSMVDDDDDNDDVVDSLYRCYLFVMTLKGYIKRFELPTS